MKFSATALLLTTLLCCKKGSADAQGTTPPELVTVNYVAVTTDFPNPERGLYRHSGTNASNFTSLNLADLKGYRMEQSIWGANYKVLSTLVFRQYVMEGFTDKPLSTTLLNGIKTDFEIARLAGVKIIPRFVYTATARKGDCPEGSICPPYGDAPKATVLMHIGQLKPVLTENADVIACVQLGLIGIWGENYYTDYFGDASQNQTVQKLLDQNWIDRTDVLKALLDAVPKDRMVQVRIPQLKQRFTNGVQADINADPLSENEAFTETDKARIGFHNDCLLSGPDDYGTYSDYGNSSSPRISNANVTISLKNYARQDTRYVVTGGETCDDAFSPANDCASAGKAEQELADMHYSFINAHYNNDVNNDWQTGGCMNSIKVRLGYRFILKNGSFPKKVKAGGAFNVLLNLENIGYASPYNARPVQLLLRNQTTGVSRVLEFNTDIRKWFTGNIRLEQSFTLPSDMLPGKYEVLLNMPDKYASIANRPEYSIRLANRDVWEEESGSNKLNYIITVQ